MEKVTPEARWASFRRVLNPVDRTSEILFGLIMVMTFTGSLSAGQAGSADVRAMLIGALSCNLAWTAARTVIADALPPLVLPALSPSDLDRIRLHLLSLPADEVQAGGQTQDLIGASAVFLLVFLLTFPVVAPFLFITNPLIALRVSNAIAIGLLFLTGYALGRHSGRPLRIAILMVAVGLAMVTIASALDDRQRM
ncbi:VIT family protein [Rhizobium sp. P32RR-XVIII]|nr:VIT family protein [Rhizobium sp. P32RR-XVIII]